VLDFFGRPEENVKSTVEGPEPQLCVLLLVQSGFSKMAAIRSWPFLRALPAKEWYLFASLAFTRK
jgi:hypothetical protein